MIMLRPIDFDRRVLCLCVKTIRPLTPSEDGPTPFDRSSSSSFRLKRERVAGRDLIDLFEPGGKLWVIAAVNL